MARVFSATSAAVVALSSVLTVGFTSVVYAAAQTCTWTGNAGDNKFSTAANWSNCGSAAPLAGDTIRLPYISGVSNAVLVNDLPQGTLLGGIVKDSSGGGTGITSYAVDTLAFGDGAVFTATSGPAIAVGDVTATGSLTLKNATSIFRATTKNITLSPTSFVLDNVPQACMGGGAPEFEFAIKPVGQVTVAANSWYTMTGTESGVTVNSGGGISLPGGTYAGDITFTGGGTTQGSACGDSMSLQAHTTTTLTGKITLGGGDIVYSVAANQTLTVTGTIEGAGSGLKASSTSTGAFVNNATVDNSTTGSGAQVVAKHEVPAVTDSKPDENLTVNANEILTFDGVRANVNVAMGAVLKGVGVATKVLYVGVGGVIAPGHSPGCISSDTLSLYGEYQFELGGAEPCTGYDQLKVTNKTTTTGYTVSFGTTPTATLATSRFNGYTPSQGQVFTIIDNQGSLPVDGTFKDLAEGATFTQNGIVFKVSYKGGDGNDVTLTVQNAPTTPDTGLALLTANPLLTIGLMTAAAGALMVGARYRQGKLGFALRRNKH